MAGRLAPKEILFAAILLPDNQGEILGYGKVIGGFTSKENQRFYKVKVGLGTIDMPEQMVRFVRDASNWRPYSLCQSL